MYDVIEQKLSEPMSMFFREYTFNGEDAYVCIRPQYFAIKQGEAYKFTLRLPKIPAGIYNCIVSLFSKIAQLYNIECLARVYWDLEEKKYKLVVPLQEASIASVRPLESEGEYMGRYLKVLEIHSHGRAYEAFWSGIDDEDEVCSTGAYGVLSFHNYNTLESCSALYRFCCGTESKVIKLSKSDLFEDGAFVYEGAFVQSVLAKNKIRF